MKNSKTQEVVPKGPAVDLDSSTSAAWEKLQEKGISKFEKDREQF